MDDWTQKGEELLKGQPWHCEKCQMEHSSHWRIVRVVKGEKYQLWKGPHMIGTCGSAAECKTFAENFNLGDLF